MTNKDVQNVKMSNYIGLGQCAIWQSNSRCEISSTVIKDDLL